MGSFKLLYSNTFRYISSILADSNKQILVVGGAEEEIVTNQVTFVDYKEAISFKVGTWLRENDFGIADINGIALDSLYNMNGNGLGILYSDPNAKPIKRLFGLISKTPKLEFIGIVWFSNNNDATGQHWILEAYGRNHVEMVRQLAEEMAQVFNVNITVHLVGEWAGEESYKSDYV